MTPNILRREKEAADGRRMQRERQLWEAERSTVPCYEYAEAIEQWPEQIDAADVAEEQQQLDKER